MISVVQTAFFRLPDLILDQWSESDLLEHQITSLFTYSLITELHALAYSEPHRRIQLESQYPVAKEINLKSRCDIQLVLSRKMTAHPSYLLIDDSPKEHDIAISYEFIEAKYFGEIGRAKGNPAKTENVGAILFDFLRLTVLTYPEFTKRFLIAVFNRDPKEYVSFIRRPWLKELFDWTGPHYFPIKVSLIGESNSLLRQVSPKLCTMSPLTLDFQMYRWARKFSNWYAYLFQIEKYKMKLGEINITDSDHNRQARIDLAHDLWK